MIRFMMVATVAVLTTGCSTTEFTKDHNGKTVTVAKGATFQINLPASSHSVHPKYRFDRPAPEVEGGSIEFLEQRETDPPQKQDGGRGREFFRFRAVKCGDSVIRIYRRGQESSKKTLDYVLNVHVE